MKIKNVRKSFISNFPCPNTYANMNTTADNFKIEPTKWLLKLIISDTVIKKNGMSIKYFFICFKPIFIHLAN